VDRRIPISRQEQFYNARWKDFTYANGINLQRCIGILSAVHATGLATPRIIDLGCGAGWLTAILTQFGPTLGVDLSGDAIRKAGGLYPHATFEHVDIQNWEFPKGKYDIVVSQEVIEHVEDQEHHLRLAHGLLRSGGFLILTTPNLRTMNAMVTEVRKSWSNQPIESWLSVREVRRLVRRQGFKIQRATTLVAGLGEKGLYRVMNSTKIDRFAARIGFRQVFETFRLRAGYGLHTLILASKVK